MPSGNISFQPAQPAFLQRLQNTDASSAFSSQSSKSAKQARPKGQRKYLENLGHGDEDEDAPVLVDLEGVHQIENGESVQSSDVVEGISSNHQPQKSDTEKQHEETRRKQTDTVSAVGVSRKRKVGRVIGSVVEEMEPKPIRESNEAEEAKTGSKKDGSSSKRHRTNQASSNAPRIFNHQKSKITSKTKSKSLGTGGLSFAATDDD